MTKDLKFATSFTAESNATVRSVSLDDPETGEESRFMFDEPLLLIAGQKYGVAIIDGKAAIGAMDGARMTLPSGEILTSNVIFWGKQ